MKGDDKTESHVELRQRLFPDYPNEHQINRFYATLGGAISAWQLVETALYEIYERAVRPGHPGAAGAAFHAIQTFNIKIAVTEAAVIFRLGAMPDLLKEWDRLKIQANKKSQRRNQLVHFSTFIMFKEQNENDKICLEPQVYDYRFARGRLKFRTSEITEIALTFSKLSESFRIFARKISALETPP